MSRTDPSSETGCLLESWRNGRPEDARELFDRVYAELRRIAGALMREERPDHTLQPTALVHEAFLALSGRGGVRVESRQHFLFVAARAMRHLLVDHARRRRAARRADRHGRVTLPDADLLGRDAPLVDVLTVHHLLDRLRLLDPRQAQLVELRYFGGLSAVEASAVLGVSEPTVRREWRAARAWFRHELASAGDPPVGPDAPADLAPPEPALPDASTG